MVQLTGYFAAPHNEKSAGCPVDAGKSPETFTEYDTNTVDSPAELNPTSKLHF
jgi:hypothetical protein